jgi:glucose/arabinose dehydrogenase
MRVMRRFWIVITLFAAACGSGKPSTPSTGPEAGPVSITGRERIGWDQPAADAGELASLQYAIYVDGTRSEMAAVSCASAPGTLGFACSGQLPSMSNGAHAVEIAAFTVTNGDTAEGGRSSPLQVIVSTALSAATAAPETEWQGGESEPTRDGVRLRIDKLTEGLDRPIDAAFAPDGRLFIVERGRVRAVSGGQLQNSAALSLPLDDPSQRLLSIAFDPAFDRSRFVFMLQTAETSDGPVAVLARYRELRGTLGQRAVLFQSPIESAGDPSALMRFGPDGKLYIAVGGDSATGKIFRLNPDGTRPGDQAGTTPALAGGVANPSGLTWDPRTPILWIVDHDSNSGHLSSVSMSAPPVRAIVRGRDDLPSGSGSTVFYTADLLPELRNNALIASTDGYVLRLRFADNSPTHIADSEKLLEHRVGPIRVVTVSPDGVIYFCTETALGSLSPSEKEK